MRSFEWIRRKFFGSRAPEKEAVVEEIKHETERLNGAVESLTLEVDVVRKHRVEMNRMLDDALQAMSRENRR